jgi:hypothetical protein
MNRSRIVLPAAMATVLAVAVVLPLGRSTGTARSLPRIGTPGATTARADLERTVAAMSAGR